MLGVAAGITLTVVGVAGFAVGTSVACTDGVVVGCTGVWTVGDGATTTGVAHGGLAIDDPVVVGSCGAWATGCAPQATNERPSSKGLRLRSNLIILFPTMRDERGANLYEGA